MLFSTDTSISDIPAFRFDKILPANKTKYFRYSGSLTTPSCKESVTWTVFRDAVNISQYQVHYCLIDICLMVRIHLPQTWLLREKFRVPIEEQIVMVCS